MEILTERPLSSYLAKRARKLTKKETITVKDYEKTFFGINKDKNKSEETQTKQIVPVHTMKDHIVENLPKGLAKRYSNLKNLINHRSSENSMFLEKVLNIKGLNEEIKAHQSIFVKPKPIKNKTKLVYNMKVLKIFRLWEKISKNKYFKANFEKLQKKTFFSNASILKYFDNLLGISDLLEKLTFNIKKIDFNNEKLNKIGLINDLKSNVIPIIENDLNDVVFIFFTNMKNVFDEFTKNSNNTKYNEMNKVKSKERFIKKRTYSLLNSSIPQQAKVNLTEDEDKSVLKKFLIYNILRFLEEIYEFNLENQMILLEVN